MNMFFEHLKDDNAHIERSRMGGKMTHWVIVTLGVMLKKIITFKKDNQETISKYRNSASNPLAEIGFFGMDMAQKASKERRLAKIIDFLDEIEKIIDEEIDLNGKS